jgi:gliding motility-associated-like protein
MGFITSWKKIHTAFLTLALMGGLTSKAQCPTVTDPTQSFCDIQSPTVSSLVATPNGNGLVWYATATSTTPLSAGQGLVNGEDYFADDNSGSCGVRQSVTVTIYTAPTGQNFQGVCVDDPSAATIADLIAVGNNVQWYSVPNGGVALPPTTQLVDNTIYYASQTNPDTGCQTSRLSVFVNVGVVPVPTGDPIQEFCVGPGIPAPTVGNLDASGDNNNWYATSSSAVPLDLSTPLIDGETYYATNVDPPCESESRFEVTAVLLEPNDAGTDGVRQICVNQVAATPPFNLFSYLGGSPDTTGTWSGPLPTANGFQGMVDISSLTLAGSPYVFTYTVNTGTCAPDSSTVTITILPLPTVTIVSNTTLCSGSSATVTFTGTPNATVTYNVNGGPNQAIVLNGAGTATITQVYTATTTYNLVSVTSAGTTPCTQAQSGSVTITVLDLPNASIAANQTICSGQSATVTITGTPNATVTYNINGGPNQTIVLNAAGTATITGSYTSTRTFNLVSVSSSGTPSCTRPLTGSVTITVVPPPTVTISSSQSVCPNAQATVTFTGTPNATVTYTVNGGPNQTITLNAAGVATITQNYAATTTYTLVGIATSGTPSCSQPQTGSVTITVLPLPAVVIAANQTICSGQSATITFTGTPNATVTYNANGGPNQLIVLNGSGTATVTGNYTATTTFNLVSVSSAGTPSCTQPVTGSVTISVVPPPTVAISSNATVCPNGSATVTFTGTPNATVTYTVNGGPNQTIVLNASGTATITQNFASTTTYALVSAATAGTPSCSQPQTGSVTITVIPPPTVTISPNATICSGQNATVTFTGTPNATVTYNVNGGPNQMIVLNAAGTATITQTYTTTTTYNLVSVATSGTPSCSQPQTGSITITVIALPIVTITANATICSGQNATVTFTGTPGATVTYNVNGGPDQTIVLNGSGTATISQAFSSTATYNLVSVATSGAPSCSQPQTGSVTITVLPPPTVTISGNATVCSNGSATVTFTGTPNATVTYTINGGPNQTIVLNGAGTATLTGNYTATTVITLVSATTPGTPSCTQPQTGTVTITVIQQPTATISGTASVCPNGQAMIAFAGTPNATVTYTVNGGPNQTIVLNGSGTASITGNFTTETTYTLVSVSTTGTPSCTAPAAGSAIITILPAPTASIAASQTICSGETATVTFTGTPNATVTYTLNGGPSQTIMLDASGSAALTNTYTQTTTVTLVSVASGSCSQTLTAGITITVLPTPTVAITANPPSVCNGDQATISFTGTPNATVTYNVNGGLNQTIILDNSGQATLSQNFTATTTFNLVSIAIPTCNAPVSESATVTVVPLPVAAVSADVASLCAGSTAVITFTGTPDATVTYNINGGLNQTIVLDASGTAVISVPVNATTTYTLVSVAMPGTPSCSQPLTGSVTVTATQPPAAGNDVTNATVCANGEPLDLFTLLGPDAQPGGTWSPALADGGSVFNPEFDTAGIYVYTVMGTPPCLPDAASVTVTIVSPPNAGEDTATAICSNVDPVDLFTLLGPNAEPGGTWSPALASGSGLFDPAVDIPGIYEYTVEGVAPCESESASVSVQVIPGPDAGQNGELTLCINSAPQDLFDALNGTPQAGGTWSPALASGNGVFDPAVDAPGVYTYTFFGNDPCDNDTATVAVTVNPIPDAGEDGEAFFCTNYPASDLLENLGGTPQPGGTWTPALASGSGVFNPLIDAPGVYTYTVGGDLCDTDAATVTVTVQQAPDAGGPGETLQACVTLASLDLFEGLDGTQGVGTWADDDVSGALSGNIFNPSAAGIGTYHFTYTVGGGDSPCEFDTATVTVIVEPQANAGTALDPVSLCNSQGTFDLSTLLDGTQTAGGVWTDADGEELANPIDVSALPAATYTFTYAVTNSCGADTESVQFTILPPPQLAIPNITLMTPICVGQGATINLNSMVDGTYDITYNLSGANALPDQTIAVTVAGGAASFAIDAANLSNTGITTITFVNIVNNATGCATTLENILVNLVVNAAPSIDTANLAAVDFCLGSPAAIEITGAVDIPDGNYQFNFSIPGGTPTGGTTGLVAISGGAGTFAVPASFFPTDGNYTVTITGIISLSGGCGNLVEDASVSFAVLPVPDVTGATISGDGTCQNTDNVISISGATALADGPYTIEYTLSGANAGTATATVAFNGGNASFTIPGASLANNGDTTVAITQITNEAGACGASGNSFTPLTFTVEQVGTPELVEDGEQFCADDNPTVADLSANIVGNPTVIWYDAPTGGNAYPDDAPLTSGTTYYAAIANGEGCESPTRLAVTVDTTVCERDIVIPDGFSPNSDNINDEFVIVNLPELYPNFRLEIYNRYGNILYKGNINTPNWDGTASQGGLKVGDGEVPVGVYFFILEFNDGQRKPLQGRLYLSR